MDIYCWGHCQEAHVKRIIHPLHAVCYAYHLQDSASMVYRGKGGELSRRSNKYRLVQPTRTTQGFPSFPREPSFSGIIVTSAASDIHACPMISSLVTREWLLKSAHRLTPFAFPWHPQLAILAPPQEPGYHVTLVDTSCETPLVKHLLWNTSCGTPLVEHLCP